MRVENSFIGAEGVGETIERRLWEAGVTHWDEFRADPIGPTRAARITDFIDAGRDALAAGDAAFFDRCFPSGELWRCYETFREGTCFFDIETTGLDHRHSVVTTVTLHRNGDTRTLVRGDDLGAESLRAAFADADLLVTFNGKRFDVPFLEACFDVSLDHPHVDLMYPCRRAGLRGSLDDVERTLGIERPGPDLGGEDAVRLWREHERGVNGALETLIRYNRQDTEHMIEILEHVVDELRPTPLEPGADPADAR